MAEPNEQESEVKECGLDVSFRSLWSTLLIGATADAQADCDCIRKPYKPDPPCYLKCVSSILFLAKSEELERLGIPAATVERIASLRTQVESPSELVASLTQEELETVRTSFDEVSDASLRSVALEISKTEACQVPCTTWRSMLGCRGA